MIRVGMLFRLPGIVVAVAVMAAVLVAAAPAEARQVTYTYEVRGWDNTTSLEDFAARAAETYAHPAGWNLGGSITFTRVPGGGDFTLWLSAPQHLPQFSSACSIEYSCRVGRNVIINEARFRGGSGAWNATGAAIRDYQHMVVNHETGHWLGFGHLACPGPGQPAPLMQQQSKAMNGCRPNPWPTPAERVTLSQWKGVPILPPGWLTGTDPGWHRVPGVAQDVAFIGLTTGWEMFHVGTGNAVYRMRLTAQGASGWELLQGLRAKRIAATTTSDDRAVVFLIGLDNAIYYTEEVAPGGSFTPARRFERSYATAVAAARAGTTWEMYHVGTSGTIWRYNADAKVFVAMPGTAALELAATTSDDGRVELFHIGRSGQTYHAWQTAPGSGFTGPAGADSWRALGDTSTAVAAANGIDGGTEVYTIRTGGSIWRLSPADYPTSWKLLTGAGTRIAATNNADGRAEILHMNSAGEMYHAWQKQVGSY